jgi:hypothetical protein
MTSLRSEPEPPLTAKLYTDLFDEVATQMRWFCDICRHLDFAMQRIFNARVSGLRIEAGTS